ncbi:protocadherin-8-like [Amia ocellicauda]|uniref:protocadherin-8-like n=1 Tax=Amia ocellicauda TaxID=2972642 RepID=UPI00346461EF
MVYNRNACCRLFITLLLVTFDVQSKTQRYSTFEEDVFGTEIGNLASDLNIDPKDDAQTSFRFIQEPNKYFNMRQTDGYLTVGERIDREQLCGQTPHCLLTFDIVTFHKETCHLIHVDIEVKDVNDHSPTFTQNEIYLQIYESAVEGTRFPLDIAVDQDVGPNYIQNYHISFNAHFGIQVRDREDGVKHAELVLTKELDREKEESFTLQVSAVDGGVPPRTGSVTVHIKVLDFNDNSPVFEHSELTVELYEDAPVGFLLFKLKAFDPDEGKNGEIVYGFADEVSAEIKQVFQIDPASGRLTLKERVDYEEQKSYEVNIKAYDLGLNSVPATCRVVVEVVDVNDNAPEISVKPMTSLSDGIAYIPEAAAEDSFVALISTSDRDSGANGDVRCSLQGHGHFKLQQAYGDTFMILTNTALDREKIAEYNLTVIAEDTGSPPFKTIKHYTIRVSDENDNAPLFSQPVYEASIAENSVAGTRITTVEARDLDLGDNGKVSYKLMDGEGHQQSPVSNMVSVDPVSGSVMSSKSFDYEHTKQFEVAIQASDGGFPKMSRTALIRVKILDTNDNSPFITHPVLLNGSASVFVPRNAPLESPVLHIAAKDDDEGLNAELSYNIVDDPQIMFSINNQTGELYLRKRLIHISGDILQVHICVKDSGNPSLSTNAVFKFIVTEVFPSDDEETELPKSFKVEQSDLIISVLLLCGVCGLLLVTTLMVGVTYHNTRKRGYYDTKKIMNRNVGEGHLLEVNSLTRDAKAEQPNESSSSDDEPVYTLENANVCSSFVTTNMGDSLTNIPLPGSNIAHSCPLQLGSQEKHCSHDSFVTIQVCSLDRSKKDHCVTIDYTIDSDLTRDGSKKFLTIFRAMQNGHFVCFPHHGKQYTLKTTPSNLVFDNCGATYHEQTHHELSANTKHILPVRRKSLFCTSIPKTKGLLQAIPRTGTLSTHVCHSNHCKVKCTDVIEVKQQLPSALSEISTCF